MIQRGAQVNSHADAEFMPQQLKARRADGWLESGSCIVNTDSRNTREGARSQKDVIAVQAAVVMCQHARHLKAASRIG